jgi:hypothetical protein
MEFPKILNDFHWLLWNTQDLGKTLSQSEENALIFW